MRLPILKPRQIINVLKKIGFKENRQTGSHLILLNREKNKIIPIPIHNQDIKRDLLRRIIKQAELSRKEFLDLLNE